MNKWKNAIVRETDTILRTMQVIDSNSFQIALVVNENMHLKGIVTDGDIRRAMIDGVSIQESVKLIMNTTPVVARNDERYRILSKMQNIRIHQIPILDEEGRLVGLEILDDLVQQIEVKENIVFLMAGGLGSRLGELTQNRPKPLLHIGKKTILETIIENFASQGYRNFRLSVNYLAEMIQEYFGDGTNWNVNIEYVIEKERMGTAGALSLLTENIKAPLIVMNGDVLTRIDFEQLVKFHNDHDSIATMCVKEYSIQIPYGVVQIDRTKLMGIVEKPKQTHFTCAGVYVLDPKVIDYLPRDTRFDMPDLFQMLVADNLNVSAYPIDDYWFDIGSKEDYIKASEDLIEMF
ncbi:MAG: nucleotidyltransferase family protein [Negativicutes bacterium]|jgi:dTDP-glucose pyrophosphorylase